MPRTPYAGRPMDRTSSSPKRMAWPSCEARKIICWPSVNRAATSSSSFSIPMAMMPRVMTLEKSFTGVFFTTPLRVTKKTKLFSSSRLRTAGSAYVRNLIDLQPVHTAGIGKNQHVGMCGRDEEVLNKIFITRFHSHATGTAAALLAIRGNRRALEISAVRHGDRHGLVGNQVFQRDLSGFVRDFGAALIAILLADFFQLLDDHVAQLLVGSQDRFVFGNLFANLAQLFHDFVGGKTREAIELQFQN